MNTYTQILYHIVFSTKHRQQTLEAKNREVLYYYIWGILKKKKCHLYQIGGVADHLHIITHLNPSVPLSDLVKNIKLASNEFIKTQKIFPNFNGWQDGYSAFTYSIETLNSLVSYTKNQEEHHKKKTFLQEYRDLLIEHNIQFDEKYL